MCSRHPRARPRRQRGAYSELVLGGRPTIEHRGFRCRDPTYLTIKSFRSCAPILFASFSLATFAPRALALDVGTRMPAIGLNDASGRAVEHTAQGRIHPEVVVEEKLIDERNDWQVATPVSQLPWS